MIGMGSALLLAAVLAMGDERPDDSLAILPMGEGRLADTMATIAGSYHFYDDWIAPCFRLEVTPEGRFTFSSMGTVVIEKNRGRAEFRTGHLILTPERPDADPKARGFATKFTPIHWGGGLVLVPEGRERDVCNIVNLGLPFDALRRLAYLRKEDETAISRNFGTRTLPTKWSPMLLPGAIEGRVVEVLANRRGASISAAISVR